MVFLSVVVFCSLGTLGLVRGIVLVGSLALAARFAYIPLMVVVLMIVWFLGEWMENWAAPGRNIALAIGLCAVSALSLDTRHEVMYWHDSVTLWSRSIEVTGNNMEGNLHYGEALLAINK